MKKQPLRIALTLMLALTFAAMANAQVTLTLLTNPITVSAGGTLLISGTIANPTGGDPQELGGVSLLIDDPLSVDETPFFVPGNFPATLNGGESATGDLFSILAPANAIPGIYTGTITLTNTAGDAISPVTSYTVTIAPAAAAPEPATFGLLALGAGCGLLGGVTLRRRS